MCIRDRGKISDRIGRKPLMLLAMLGSAVLHIPMLNLIQNQMWQLALAISVMCLLLGAYLAIAPAVYAELFPTNVRATAFGIPYAITIAAFSPISPVYYTHLDVSKRQGRDEWVREHGGIDLHRHREPRHASSNRGGDRADREQRQTDDEADLDRVDQAGNAEPERAEQQAEHRSGAQLSSCLLYTSRCV